MQCTKNVYKVTADISTHKVSTRNIQIKQTIYMHIFTYNSLQWQAVCFCSAFLFVAAWFAAGSWGMAPSGGRYPHLHRGVVEVGDPVPFTKWHESQAGPDPVSSQARPHPPSLKTLWKLAATTVTSRSYYGGFFICGVDKICDALIPLKGDHPYKLLMLC